MSNELTTKPVSEDELIYALQTSLYVGAKVESVQMVLGYCRAAGLDPMQKPVHIVPIWDSKLGGMRDVVMPGIGLYRTQASRTGEFAGITEPEFGPMITEQIGGATITYPEYARCTVERLLPSGKIAKFTAVEYWMENYAVRGGKEKSIAPNTMWAKRPRGQIAKCAEAQALRKAFPELGSAPTAEEMEGKQLYADAETAPRGPDWVDVLPMIAAATATKTDAEALQYWKDNNAKLAKQKEDHKYLKDVISLHRAEMKAADEARTIEAEPSALQADAAAEHADFVAGLDEGSAQ